MKKRAQVPDAITIATILIYWMQIVQLAAVLTNIQKPKIIAFKLARKSYKLTITNGINKY